MKTMIIYPTFLIVFFFILAKTTINFKPFKITFEQPYLALGWVLIIIGVMFIQYQSQKDVIKQVFETIQQWKLNKLK